MWSWALHTLRHPEESNGTDLCLLHAWVSQVAPFSPDRGEFPWLDVARGRNTLFQPVPFPSVRRPSRLSGSQFRNQDYCMFLCEGTYPRGHGENMQTPHRKALSPTPLGCKLTWDQSLLYYVTRMPHWAIRKNSPLHTKYGCKHLVKLALHLFDSLKIR